MNKLNCTPITGDRMSLDGGAFFDDLAQVRTWIRQQAQALGFADCGFVSVNNPIFEQQLEALKWWLNQGYHAGLDFMYEHHDLRAHPDKLVAGAKTIISVRMDYLSVKPPIRSVDDNNYPNHAIIARYARGRDYHKIMRARLKKLALCIQEQLPAWSHLSIGADKPFVFRPFADSAPIFERALAQAAGLGFTGKHTLLIHPKSGSFFVLGELFISLDLVDETTPIRSHCGSCTACIDICPTKAIVAPFVVDARACISYLTIEHDGVIDEKYRKAMGNRVFGCDDCQLICPWNRYAKLAQVSDFAPRHRLDEISLLELWAWDEATFLTCTEGSPLRRTGYDNFLRNVAIALGNANAKQKSTVIQAALCDRLGKNAMLDEHINWALVQAE